MVLIAILYAVFAAMAFINSKLMLTNPYPFFVGMLRALGSSVLLLSYGLIFHRQALRKFRLPFHGWKDLILFGVFVHGFAMCGYSYALQYMDPVKFCFILALNPFVTAILQYFIHGEMLTHKKIIGLSLGFLGLVPILLAADHGEFSNIPQDLEILGTVTCLVSTILFSYGWIVMKRYLKEFTHPIEIANAIAMFVGGCVSAMFFTLAQYYNLTANVMLTPEFPKYMVAFVIFSLATYLLYAYLLDTFSPTFIAFAGFLEPVFGLAFGVIFLGHPITIMELVALGILFVGLNIFYREELRASPVPTMEDEDVKF